MDLLLATGNPHKVREMSELFGGLDLTLHSAIEFPDYPEIEEGADYTANAILKARVWTQRTGLATLADDSGLEVDALAGRPGVHSSRYAPTNDERIARLLAELDGVADGRRTARFVCYMALVLPNGQTFVRQGVCEGRIAHAVAGSGGFGYDPIFDLPERGCTMAELSDAEKNQISHRARAAQAIHAVIRSLPADDKG